MILNEILKLLFPNRCLGCGEIIEEDEFICEYCFEMLERVSSDKLCFKCGCHKRDCDCRRLVYSFDGIAAPFHYEGIARRVMYSFKFRKKLYYGRFFAENMALAFKQSFPDIRFDLICFVPMYSASERKRGYNQSKILAGNVSEILGIKLLDNALHCLKKKRSQHKTPLKERFDNVRGIYYTDLRMTGQTVLLIDDIKTTGATLNECASVLLKAGAGRVYCLTALTTKKRKKGKKNGN